MLSDVMLEIAALVPEIGELLNQEDVTEVMCNPNGSVWTEREGRLQREPYDISSLKLEPAVYRAARSIHKDISAQQPLLETRLPDGSRLAAAFPPVSKDGVTLSIRRFPRRYSVAELVEREMLTEEQAGELLVAVRDGQNILISGGTGAGKTTLLNALLREIPLDQRIIIIEDVSEIFVERENVVQLESGAGLTIRDCLRHALRQRPDRIIVGEVRGGAAYDMLQAWNTGHGGSMATTHAECAELVPLRLQSQAMESGVMSDAWIHRMVKESLHVVVHVVRGNSGRRVEDIWRPKDAPASVRREIEAAIGLGRRI